MLIIHKVKCIYCQQYFDRDKTPTVIVNGRRYAHQACADNAEQAKVKELQDRMALEDYINQLFGTTFLDPKIQKLINSYITQYHFTYNGILRALKYWYEVKRNSLDKANGSIGIVPYIYTEGNNYFYKIWAAQMINQDKEMAQYQAEDIEITISPPQRKIKKRHCFNFLDDEVIANGE